MKRFIDIEVVKAEETGLVKPNTLSFEEGDHIVIEEKVDGSNASISYLEDGTFHIHSRNRELVSAGDLHGFFDLAQAIILNPAFEKAMKKRTNFALFGEWDLCVNKLKDYLPEHQRKWIVYDAYDGNAKRWLTYNEMVEFYREIESVPEIEFIHVLYDGPFVSWEHCRSFMHQNTYGPSQEGIVIKNQDKMQDEENRFPFYLKLVNESFKETRPKVRHQKSENQVEEMNKAREVVDSIVTKRRIEKALERLRDDGVLPMELSPVDMGTIAKFLPKAVYDDCMKEERETVAEGGPSFGKALNYKVMSLAREIVLGK